MPHGVPALCVFATVFENFHTQALQAIQENWSIQAVFALVEKVFARVVRPMKTMFAETIREVAEKITEVGQLLDTFTTSFLHRATQEQLNWELQDVNMAFGAVKDAYNKAVQQRRAVPLEGHTCNEDQPDHNSEPLTPI